MKDLVFTFSLSVACTWLSMYEYLRLTTWYQSNVDFYTIVYVWLALSAVTTASAFSLVHRNEVLNGKNKYAIKMKKRFGTKLIVAAACLAIFVCAFGLDFMMFCNTFTATAGSGDHTLLRGVKTYLFTTEANRCRMATIVSPWINHLNLEHEVVYGYTYESPSQTTGDVARALNLTEIDTDKFDTYLKLYAKSSFDPTAFVQKMTYMRNMRDAHAANPDKEWILWLEDDAEPVHDVDAFPRILTNVLKEYSDYDVIMLDIRSVIGWTFARYPSGGLTGVLFKREALPRIFANERVDSERSLDLMRYRHYWAQIDDSLIRACYERVYKCQVVGLTKEARVRSTRRAVGGAPLQH